MATKVMHGRRRGRERVFSPPQFCVENQATKPAEPTDIRQVTVLTKGDWNRIQEQLNRKQIEQERIQRIKAAKEELKNKSRNMVKNWTNTIAGQRQKKLEARQIREAKLEEERVAIDLEEARYQAQMRKEAIEKAKTQQYYQTDRVKNFHGALTLTEVLKEREAQLELKELIGKANESKDNDWLQKQQRAYEEGIRRDQEKAAERAMKAKQNAEFLKLQALEHERQRLKDEEEDRKEAEELKKLADMYHSEKKQLEEIQFAEKRQQAKANRQQFEELKKLRDIQAQQEEEEDEECRIFAAAKRKMMKLRALKEKEIQQEKQKILDNIRDKLSNQMKEFQDNEDTRIKEAVEEADEKRRKEDEEREHKVMMAIKAQQEDRLHRLQMEEEQKKKDKLEMLEMLRLREEADKVFHINEMMKAKRKKEAADFLANYQLQQKAEREREEREERERQIALDQANVELLKTEEAQFQEYAQKVIKHCQDGGRNIYPLKKAAKEGAGGGLGPVFQGKGGLRPSYMVSDTSGVQLPCFKGESTENTKQMIEGKYPTKARCGFVW